MKFYLKPSALTLWLLMALTPASFAASDTEFGERFTNQTPAALQDAMTAEDLFAADILNQIAPAGGEADPAPKADAATSATQDQGQNDDTAADPRQKLGIEWQPAEPQD